MENWALFVRQQ